LCSSLRLGASAVNKRPSRASHRHQGLTAES
jgi:hypothetical protein